MDVKVNGNVSFWYADIGGAPPYRDPLPGDRDADVCVVGGGFTGLWTSYYLKKANPDLRIVVVEKEFAGFGASGRNGGWLSGGFGWSREKYLKTSTRGAVIDMEAAMHGTVEEVIGVAEAEGIDADIRRTDTLTVATSMPQLQRIKAGYEDALHWSVPRERISLIGQEEMRARIDVRNALGGFVHHGAARVQPAKLVRGLAAVVERMGVPIFEQTEVTRIEKGAVTTNRGTVRAPVIVRATEGFTAGIPGFERLWIPMNSAILMTEPLSDELWAKIGWNGYELLGDAAHAYCYA
ncbi:MAG: FAD-dependent oxidoreductase, partial [Pseudaminobacter sp.]|nr:FAD-dependent oxidoreductase [Pseudaminobacter sp.]